ncbi:MAG: hypothetical protein CFE44_09780 [Burkholderiales bacterium PBB4]|nr:MAG: hypothetical protein CFE44_09780 [Burkholderiales bacterium PBB4]
MKKTLITLTLFSGLCLSGCERPNVVAVPVAPVAVPGPAGPAGPTGTTGATGSQGAPGAVGEKGSGTTINVLPPASAPSN